MSAVETFPHPQTNRLQLNALLSGVTEAARLLLSIADIDAAVNKALEAIASPTKVDRIYICQHQEDPSTQQIDVACLYTWTKSETDRSSDNSTRAQISFDAFQDWLSRGEAMESIQTLNRPLSLLIPERPALDPSASTLVIPIFIEKKCWGSVWFEDSTTQLAWERSEIAALETAAACIGNAIERDRLNKNREATARVRIAELLQVDPGWNNGLERLANEPEFHVYLGHAIDAIAQTMRISQERTEELAKTNEAISQTLNTLASNPQLSDFLGQLLLAISDNLGACKAHLFLYDEPSHTLSQFVAVQEGQVYRGSSPIDPVIFKHPVPADITPGWSIIMSSLKPFTFDENSPYEPDIWWPGTFEWHQAQGHTAVTCVPMKTGDRPVGYIGFCFRNRPVLTDEQLEFMQALSNQAIVAIQLTRLAEQARTNALNDERNRLAREIHDTLAHAFTGVSLQLEAVRGLLLATTSAGSSSPSSQALTEVQACIRRARALARAGLSEARRSVRALRSEALETDSLPDALRKVLAQTQRDADLNTDFILVGEPVPLPDDLELNVLRVSQEAITNTLRHANATKLDLCLKFEGDRLLLSITDDGVGFDPAQPEITQSGFGLLGIRERIARFYGTFNLQSAPGSGTTLEAIVPLNQTDPS